MFRRFALFSVLSITGLVTGPSAWPPSDIPIGAHVELELREGPDVSGRVLAVRGDAVVVLNAESGIEDSIALDRVAGIRVIQSGAVWRTTHPSKIKRFRLVTLRPVDRGDPPRQRLMLFREDAVVMLDAGTGAEMWAIDDIPKPDEAHLAHLYGLGARGALTVKDGPIIGLDLETGERLWTLESLPFTDWEFGFYTVDHHVLLTFGKTTESDATLLAIDAETGAAMWRRDDLFTERPRSSWGYQVRWIPRDSALLLYASKDGPIALDPMTGELRWRADGLASRDVPTAGRYAPILVDHTLFFTPSEKGLMAFRLEDGSAAWDSIVRLRSRPIQMAMTDHGLLVRGANPDGNGVYKNSPFVMLFDPLTGNPRWDEEFRKLKNTTGFVVRGDTAYLAADRRLVALHLPSGSVRTVTDFEFEGGEEPRLLSLGDLGLELIGAHNLLALDTLGRLRYHGYWKKPGTSFGEFLTRKLLPALFDAAIDQASGTYTYGDPTIPIYRPGARTGHRSYYAYTGEPTREGLEGFGLVKVGMARGEEEGRVWIDARNPSYLLDTRSGMVYLADDEKLSALRFLDWASAAEAAETDNLAVLDTLFARGVDSHLRSDSGITLLMMAAAGGSKAVVDRLLEGAVDVNAVDHEHFSALMWASLAGHRDVVERLLRHGAEVNPVRSTDWAWTPWNLALREGHDEIADLLVENGAPPSEPEALLMRAWLAAMEGEPTSAVDWLDSAMTLAPDLTPPSEFWITLCFRSALWGAVLESEVACREAVDLDPAAIEGWRTRAMARAMTGDPEGAVSDLDQALQLGPAAGWESTLRRWRRYLRAGKTPFTPDVLERMRNPER